MLLVAELGRDKWEAGARLARRKAVIKTFGCRCNVYDSARMADVAGPLVYAPAPARKRAT